MTVLKLNKTSTLFFSPLHYHKLFLGLTCLLAFLIRLYPIIRYETVIHEYDPYFNYRVTKILTEKGIYHFWNFFDDSVWYPLGRPVGQTLYPGLMLTTYVIYKVLGFLTICVPLTNLCVFIAPLFSSLTCLATYKLTYLVYKEFISSFKETDENFVCIREIFRNEEVNIISFPLKCRNAGLVAAVLISVCPSYISRSVAGSYDNEAIAIFAMINSFYLYIRALKKTTIKSALIAALGYYYMVLSWGGYVFVLNTITLHILATLLLNCSVDKHHLLVFNTFYILGTALSTNVPFVSYSIIRSTEHLFCHVIFIIVNGVSLYQWLSQLIKDKKIINNKINLDTKIMSHWKSIILITFSIITPILYFVLKYTNLSARSLALIDPTYASKHAPLVASVSEHQPPVWSSYFFDLHICAIFTPFGLFLMLSRKNPRKQEAMLFIAIYALLSVYFSSIMIRLLLVFAPAACILSGIGLSHLLHTLSALLVNLNYKTNFIYNNNTSQKIIIQQQEKEKETQRRRNNFLTRVTPLLILILLTFITILYILHSNWAAFTAFSHPSIVTSITTQNGTRILQDDYREAYYWLRHNTPPHARVAAWWDYGYQLSAMAQRPVILDNNTWDNTHIARVALAFVSPEKQAYEILKSLDADYVYITFGALSRNAGDDINKFLWMTRIASSVFPQVQEAPYLTAAGTFSVGVTAGPALVESLLYKLAYHRFASTGGFDYVRNTQIPTEKPINLTFFQEVYTTQNWTSRIYKVVNPTRGPKVAARFSV